MRTVLPDIDIDLDDPNIDSMISQQTCPSVKNGSQPLQSGQVDPWVSLEETQQGKDGEKDSMLESMVANTGSLDLDDEGHWDFHGHSSGRVFLAKMRERFGHLMGKEDHGSKQLRKSRNVSQSFYSPRSTVESPRTPNFPNTRDLPEKHSAQLLCENALNDCWAILRFVHQPTFYAMLDRVYEIPRTDFGDQENSFLPLLYSVIALGSLFAKEEHSILQTNGYENAIDQGYLQLSIIT